MAGLDTRGLASGFTQGFGMMDRYYRGQAQQERADQRMDMEEKRFGLQMETAQMEKEKLQRERDLENVKFTLGKVASGMDVSEEEVETLKQYPKFWAALDPATDQSIAKAEKVLDPEQPDDLNDPEALAATNQMFGAEVNKGAGGQKRIVGAYPSPDGNSLMFDLEVDGEDGQRYNAPMTEGRSPDRSDDIVKPVDVGEAVNQLKGMKMLRSAFQTPEAQQRASNMLQILRGEDNESWSVENHPQLGMIQRNTTTGEIQPIKPGAGSPHEDQGSDYWSRPTATQKDIEYMVANGLADSREEAWERLNTRSGRDDYGRSKDRIEALKDRATNLEEVVRGETATTPTDEEREAAREELADIRQRIRQEENQTYGIRMPESNEPEPEPDPSQSEKLGGPEMGDPRDSRQHERGARPGPSAEERRPEHGGQTDGQPSADDILNKYL